MSSQHLNKAIAEVNLATKYDNDQEFQKALDSYTRAITLFIHARNYEIKGAAALKTINEKIAQYMDRAELLKKHLNDQKKAEEDPQPVAHGESNSTSNNKEDKEAAKLQSALEGAIVVEKPNVKWSDVAGLEMAKQNLQEAVIFPIKFPNLFTGKRQPWRGILLYGPPGTGKSYLAKAVATEANNSTFLSISASDLVSKWQGESERLVKTLFQMARDRKPSIIFIDEIDSVAGQRGDNEPESSRRIKTELLVQMQGVGNDNDGVLVLGATNIPWMLDSAIRRRFERRIHIGLPKPEARARMFKLHMGDTPNTLTERDYEQLGKDSDNYSGADCAVCVRDGIMEPVRRLQTATHFKQVGNQYTPCSPSTPGAVEMSWQQLSSDQLLEPKVDYKMMKKALSRTRPTVNAADLDQVEKWSKDFGTEG